MTASDEMACIELVEVVTDYLEGKLSAADRTRFDAHLAGCPYCVEYVEQFRHAIEATGRLSLDSIAPEKREEVLKAFRGWRERRI